MFVGETTENEEGKKTLLICCRPNWLHSPPPAIAKVADPHHFNAAPDPAFHFNAEPDPEFHFNAGLQGSILSLYASL